MLSWTARPLLSSLRIEARHLSQTTVARAPKSGFWPSPISLPNHHTISRVSIAAPKDDDPISQFFFRSASSTQTDMYLSAEKNQKIWDRREANIVSALPRPQTTYSGRSVLVERDFIRAYRRLQTRLAKSNFTYELRLGERHEKKGAKRRRLVSERWRRRFAHEVRKKVQLVNEIRARGA